MKNGHNIAVAALFLSSLACEGAGDRYQHRKIEGMQSCMQSLKRGAWPAEGRALGILT